MLVSQLHPSPHLTVFLIFSIRTRIWGQDLCSVFLFSSVHVGEKKCVDTGQNDDHTRTDDVNESDLYFRSTDDIETHKTRFIIVVFVNLGPSLVGKSQVLVIPPYQKSMICTLDSYKPSHGVSCNEPESDTGRTTIVRFRVVGHPSGNYRYRGIHAGYSEKQRAVRYILMLCL